MPNRQSLVFDLFRGGLPEDLAARLALEAPPWLMLNVPVEFACATDAGRPLSTIDVVGGGLDARSEGDLAEIEKRAEWHFPRATQRKERRLLATELALTKGLLRPSIENLFALQLHAPCSGVGAEDLAQGLVAVGFSRAIVLVGDDAATTGESGSGYAIVRSRVEKHGDGLRLSIGKDATTWPGSRHRTVSKELRTRMCPLLNKMHLPRRLPVVINMSPPE